jgi:hypothetical protein
VPHCPVRDVFDRTPIACYVRHHIRSRFEPCYRHCLADLHDILKSSEWCGYCDDTRDVIARILYCRSTNTGVVCGAICLRDDSSSARHPAASDSNDLPTDAIGTVDAELVAWCDYRKAGDQLGGKIAGEGAIDVPDVREAIKRIMEGGEAAFNLRREKYGF